MDHWKCLLESKVSDPIWAGGLAWGCVANGLLHLPAGDWGSLAGWWVVVILEASEVGVGGGQVWVECVLEDVGLVFGEVI